MRTDLIVIGAGPAGANAALSAAAAGLSVVLLDEQDAAGGQVWRKPLDGLPKLPASPEQQRGNGLRQQIAASSIQFLTGRRVWSIGGAFRVDALGPAGNEMFEAPRLIAATGAHERVVPFPGWTLPGVIGLAAATNLLKSHGVLPGNRIVVAGCGPLLVAVAAGVLKLGGTVAAIVDLDGRGDWLRALPSLASQPRLLAQGVGWMMKIGLANVPYYRRHGVMAAMGDGQLHGVTLGPVDDGGASIAGATVTIEADCLCVGHGLVAGSEVTRLLRAEHRYDGRRGGFVPVLDDAGRTSISGLYACGDGYGVRGAASAEWAGRLAGLAAARDADALGSDDFDRKADECRRGLTRLQRFSDAMADRMALRAPQVATVPEAAIVCRCEDVSRADVEAAIAAGARDVNQLKHFTRCGMGPCQGRMCGDVAGALLAAHVGGRDAAGCWTMRPPLRPIPLEDLMGTFDYSDIPIPKPAPL